MIRHHPDLYPPNIMSLLPRSALFALASAMLALPSCESIPGPEEKQSTAWALQHSTFRAGEGWKKNSFVNDEVVGKLTTTNTTVKVHLYEQRGLVLHEGRDVAIDFPVSSGRRAFPTKPGSYTIIDKKLKHSSNLYGKYVEAESGKVLNSDVDTTADKMPEGARYVGSPMPYFLRLTNNGLGLHIGIVPGYPASHGCVRVPRTIMPKVYGVVHKGTPVEIIKDAPATEPVPAKGKETKTGTTSKVARN